MTTKQIYESIDEGNSLKDIAQAYSEIASIKLKRIRSEVERNRDFFSDITAIYKLVKFVAALKGITLGRKPKAVVSVVLTSNYRFYGNINNDLVRFFKVKSATMLTDRIIIGRTGSETLRSSGYSHSYQTVFFKKDLPSDLEMRQLVNMVKDYRQVLIYYSQLKSVLVQKSAVKDITQTPILNPIQLAPKDGTKYQNILSYIASFNSNPKTQKSYDFIFEPDIEKMLDFFENQIKTLLLEQTFLESELARTASRLISMDNAQQNATKFIGDQNKLLGIAKRSLVNIRMLDTYAALYSWRLHQ